MNKDDFKERIDKELGGMAFSAEASQRVLDAVKKPGSRLNAFLNKELRIPVQPLAAALLLAATLMIYVLAGEIKVSPEDIQKSRITVVENSDGRQANDIYKN